jgi:hypothetical protein
MNFSEMGIPVGSVLIYEDGVTEATVKNHREIIYKGDTTTLTTATR